MSDLNYKKLYRKCPEELFSFLNDEMVVRAFLGLPDDFNEPNGKMRSDIELAIDKYNGQNETDFDLTETTNAFLTLYTGEEVTCE